MELPFWGKEQPITKRMADNVHQWIRSIGSEVFPIELNPPILLNIASVKLTCLLSYL